MTTGHAANWDSSKPIREQQHWDAHAAFLDDLVEEGFIVLGGPLDDGENAMLVIATADETEARHRLDGDPWISMGMLHVETVRRWSIWLDGRATGTGTERPAGAG